MTDEQLRGALVEFESMVRSTGATGEIIDARARELLSESELRQDARAQCRILGSLAFSHTRRGHLKRALEVALEELSVAQGAGLEDLITDAQGRVGFAYLRTVQNAEAIPFLEAAMEGARRAGDMIQVARNSDNLGSAYFAMSNYVQALKYYRESLRLSEEQGDQRATAGTMHNIGIIYHALGDYTHALEYYHRAMAINEAVGNTEWLFANVNNIGLVYKNSGDYTSALVYYHKSKDLKREVPSARGSAVLADNIGSVYLSLKEYDHALECFSEVLALSEEHELRDMYAKATGALGSLYANKEYRGFDPIKAEDLLLKAITLTSSLGIKKDLYDLHKSLADFYALSDRKAEAYDHFKVYHELEREVHSEEAQRAAEQFEQQKMLSAERAASESTRALLHKVLPSSIADRLVRGEKIADYFQIISILFVDIVGFTPIAARMPAKAVLAFLNYVFGEFDRVMKKHGVQKIKTIGDGYMAVSGAPVECSDHAERLARAALELMADIQLPDEIRKTLPKESVFHLRMGLHTGSAFAGIVGDEGFVYDVYSDAVNLAARMEATGEPGKIHCSEEFAYHLQNRDESFVLEERGEIEVKGKGLMRTFFLERVA